MRTLPRRWIAVVFAACAIFAGAVALFSTNHLHQRWGTMAACGYLLAAVAVLVWPMVGKSARGIDLALVLALCGALLVPLAWMATGNSGQPEVAVIVRAGATLIHHGTPYQSDTVTATTQNPDDYNPYLPVMALFGLPRAFFGSGVLADPRIWFGLVFGVVFWLALRKGGARDSARWTFALAASPVIAFELTVGGDDVPMVAFLCLGYALLWQSRPVASGVALGIGAAMKATAWPAVAVAFVYLLVTSGRRSVLRFTLAVGVIMVVCVGPFLATHPRSLVKNTILFPLGLAHVQSQAVSPLPGHLLAETGSAGHMAVVVLLGLAGLGIAVSLVVRPPRTVPSATIRLVVALSLMFVLAPSTRFGYFIYPAALVIWLLVCLGGRRTLAGTLQGPAGAGNPVAPAASLPVPPGQRSRVPRMRTTLRTRVRSRPAG
jgi:hypothetical protein